MEKQQLKKKKKEDDKFLLLNLQSIVLGSKLSWQGTSTPSLREAGARSSVVDAGRYRPLYSGEIMVVAWFYFPVTHYEYQLIRS